MSEIPNPKRNKRRIQGTSHIGGAMSDTFDTSDTPYEISEQEVRRRKLIREDKEDLAVFG